MLYEAGSRRRGVWLGVSLCLSASALSLSRDLLLCAGWSEVYRFARGRDSQEVAVAGA
jgi:hypothetical protein